MDVAPPPLAGWTVLSLRPQDGHGGLRTAASRLGAGFIAAAPLRIVSLDNPPARTALAAALRCPCIVVTSPNAVRHATRLARLPRTREWVAVGAASAAALRRLGIARVVTPPRADSEGLLAMPQLSGLRGAGAVGLLTGRGGRGLLQPALEARGVTVQRADVYARVPAKVAPAAWRRLRAALADGRRIVLPLTSAEGWAAFAEQLPADLHEALHDARVVVPGARLEALARRSGFADIAVADGPHPAQLLAAALRG